MKPRPAALLAILLTISVGQGVQFSAFSGPIPLSGVHQAPDNPADRAVLRGFSPIDLTTYPFVHFAEDRPATSPHRPHPDAGPKPDRDKIGTDRNFDRPQRASPEAVNDLFQLLKQASPKQGSKPK